MKGRAAATKTIEERNVPMAFTLQQLSDLEEIRQLKHKYFRCIDLSLIHI